ncbi:hypothetical protein OVA13_10240 [Pseudoxanthomonas sp. SL93]|uniref:hypothetical protein n=1 Tax=Pseudoxanthomonas sp. SL93 TaxID=2995142 RepID=UPI00226F11F0|nr:hypothetical protein [Pseudoxanthomonas sp. SL93]WAC61792.1 hypothetical protein OVA13_10240 [Pseudoxanthomonas sp. SL93]
MKMPADRRAFFFAMWSAWMRRATLRINACGSFKQQQQRGIPIHPSRRMYWGGFIAAAMRLPTSRKPKIAGFRCGARARPTGSPGPPHPGANTHRNGAG